MSDPDDQISSARHDLACGRMDAAEDGCLRVLGTHRHHPGALQVLGEILSNRGRYDEAVRVFNALTLMQPTVAAHWESLGAVLRTAGRPAQSLAAFERALRLGPPTPGLLYNLGVLQMDRLDYVAAHLALGDALKLVPRDARIRWAYAQCCFDMGRRQEAVIAIEDWETLDELSVDITVSIALLLVIAGAARPAQLAVQRLLADPPTRGRAAVGFALLLERLHRLDEARTVLRQLERDETTSGSDPARLAISALLAERVGQHAEAYQQLTAALAVPQDFVHRFKLLFPLAKACDALGRYEEAFKIAGQAHESQLAFLERVTGKASAEQSQLWALTASACTADDVGRWSISGPAMQSSPIFVVGFPRSGTTLLEQILDAHPQLQSMDEQPLLLQSLSQITARGCAYPTDLGALSHGTLEELRANYWNGVRNRVSLSAGQRLVDKNPMNMVLLPIIRRIFPHAPVVIVLRHPCDAIISFFLQNFPSDLALLGRDLAAVARSYARAFAFWDCQCTVLGLRQTHYELKYEDLATNLASEVQKLCTFLRLPQHKAMLTPGDHARSKGFISTPSYAQVIGPVSNRAVGRWKQYTVFFGADELALLAPWIRRWGYSLA